jgi:hypothetical protein
VPAFSIFVALVAIVTAQFGRRAGVIVEIASALAFNFFFVPPVLEFTFPPVAQEYIAPACTQPRPSSDHSLTSTRRRIQGSYKVSAGDHCRFEHQQR